MPGVYGAYGGYEQTNAIWSLTELVIDTRYFMKHIICFGNPLHGDDGFGTVVYQRLSKQPMPENVRLFDAGTPGLKALTLFDNCNEIIIVDALASQGNPGRLHFLTPQQISDESVIPGHGIGVCHLLKSFAALSEARPNIKIIAVEVDCIIPFMPGLSLPVTRATIKAEQYIAEYIGLRCYA